MRNACPGCCAAHSGPRSARPEHRLDGALLIRGPSRFTRVGPGSAEQRRRGAAPRPGYESWSPAREHSRFVVQHRRNRVDQAGGGGVNGEAGGVDHGGSAGIKRLAAEQDGAQFSHRDRKSTRLNSSHVAISYAVFCLKKKTHIRLPSFSMALSASSTIWM